MSYDDDRYWVVFKYPDIMGRDFFLPWLRNMQAQGYLTEADWKQLNSWQAAVMEKTMLQAFYLRVQKLREPFWEEVRKHRLERKRTSQRPTESSKKPKEGEAETA